jgi:hypothetical protein
MSFDANDITEIVDENIIRKKLFYLTFKTSDSDGLVKYIFGDILYGLAEKNSEVIETGYYRMGRAFKEQKLAYNQSSFDRGREDAVYFNGTRIEPFRVHFNENKQIIESFLLNQKPKNQMFLHFDFGGKHWYELQEELDKINTKLLDDFVDRTENGIVLKKSLYKTIASAEKDTQFPGFNSSAIHKVKHFSDDSQLMDLIYAVNFSERAIITEKDVKIIVLPFSKNLTADEIEDFFDKKTSLDEVESSEDKLATKPTGSTASEMLDSLFEPVVAKVSDKITHFDFIFSKKGGISSPDVDLEEVAGIERSLLSDVARRIRSVRIPLDEERDLRYSKRPQQFQGYLEIRRSLFNILADTTKAKKKYQSHLFKILPQIYTANYRSDPVLLPVFIEKVEFNIRNATSNFNLLKYDYFFLINIQTSNGGYSMDEMHKSKSYRAGQLLGMLARPLGVGKKRKIASFEKNYVGLLSRRITDRTGLVKFKNFVDEKLAIHDVAYKNLKTASVELAQLVSNMPDNEYNKNYCAFGFFESYFAYIAEAEEDEASSENEIK